ncbi:MAG: AsnC family transcriptional regulator [Candidatus Micrarchaeota archaeon]|nr:AsnC family transcriptional regulator [Candidatus Micrarchaeota archaeon]
MVDYEFRSEFNEKWSPLLKKMIRLLSEDSRMSITKMTQHLGVSRKTVGDKLKKAEAELGIRYTLELDENALGLDNPHLILIKFTEKPNYDEVAKILSSSHITQLAARVEGSYDLFVYANAENSGEYVYWDKTMQVMLSKYKAHWQPSDLAFSHLGFFPIRNALLQRLNIPKTYKEILLLLNENARMSLNEMARRLGMKPNTLAYNLNKLLKMGYIKRFTITMGNPPKVSMMSLFGKYIIAEGFEDDSMKMRKELTFLDDKMPLISRCLFSAQLIGSYDFFFVGVYDNDAIGLKHLIRYYKDRFKRHKVKVMYGTIGKVILGNFPVRNLDVRAEFNMIKWTPGVAPKAEKPAPLPSLQP